MKLTFDTGEMYRISQQLVQLAGEYTDIYNRLMNTASTMGDAWKAPDNIAYVEQITGFCDNLKAMTSHIEQASAALDQQAKNYEKTIEENIGNVKKLQN